MNVFLSHPAFPANPKPARSRRRMRLARIRRAVRNLLLCLLMLGIVQSSSVSPARTFEVTLNGLLSGRRFDLVAWEVRAIAEKLTAGIRLHPPAATDPQAAQRVAAYMELSQAADELEGQIGRAYAGLPPDSPPTAEIAALETQLASLRKQQFAEQASVEIIMQRQISALIQQEGLETAGLVWPPVWFRLTPLPLHLVISPRERIELQQADDLRAGLSLTERQRLEQQIDTTLDVSSLVEELGGYGTYPTMVLDIPSLEWLSNTVAHEWTHNYLAFHPLGLHYSDSPDLRTINETVASIVGEDLSARLIAAYYPHLTPPTPSWQLPPRQEEASPAPTGAFDYARFMRETRQHADELLSQGKIEEAEAYMEERRQALVARGYVLRKLNQAYFAFHGLYATSPSAVNPIGPTLEALRRRSASLAEFMHTVSAFRQPADLDQALQQAGVGSSRLGGQRNAETISTFWPWLHPDLAAMSLHDQPAESQP